MVRCSLKSITILSVFLLLALFFYISQKPLFISFNATTDDAQSYNKVSEEPDNQFMDDLTTTTSENSVTENIYYQIPPTNSVTYIRAAYRVYNTEIRISVVKLHRSRVNIYYKYGNEIGKLYFICELSTCLDYYSKPCNMIGYIGLIKSNKLGNHEYIYFSTTNHPQSFNVKIKLQFVFLQLRKDVRVRLNHVHPHILGVCVQPIYLHADHFLFINFFEYWLSQGATKFYIYRESYSKEVQKVLDYYLTASEASIEFIDWSQLPSPENEENVNKYIYRLEMMLSIFDCVTRSRSHVKFLAQTDLDEFIYIKNGTRVIDFMNVFSEKHSDFSSASFSSQRIAFQKDFFNNFDSLNDISFSFLENVKIEQHIFKRPYYSKLIYRPERVLRVHPHKQMQPDRPYFVNQRYYKNALVDNTEGLVMHMRRINDTFEWKPTENSTIFSSLAKTLTKNYLNRLKKFPFNDELNLQNIGIQIVEEVENCRKKASQNRTHQCHSVYSCEKDLSEKHQNFFIHVNNSWIFL